MLASLVLTAAGAAATAAQAATVSGTVTYGRDFRVDPLFGATVTLTDRSSGRTVASATSAADGTWSLIAADGTYDVTVSALGYRTRSFDDVEVVRATTLDATLVATDRVRFALTVTVGGRPAQAAGVDDVTFDGWVLGLDDDSRLVAYPLAGESHTLWLSTSDWSYASDRFALTEDAEETLALPEETTLTVRVSDGTDPVVGATVHVPATSATVAGVNAVVTGGQLVRPWQEGTTDGAGEVRVPAFVGSTAHDYGAVRTPDLPQYDDAPLYVGTIGPDHVASVWLPRMTRLTGTLADGDGPLAGYEVGTRGERSPTASDGSFDMRVQTNWSYLLITHGDAVGDLWLTADMTFERDRDLQLRLPTRERRIVRVVDGHGRPIQGALVTAPPLYAEVDLGNGLTGQARHSNLTAATDADGEVELRAFPGARPHAGARPGTVVAPEGSGLPNAELVLDGAVTTVVLGQAPPPTVTVTGVLRPLGESVAGATLYFGPHQTTTARDGSFSFTVEPGAYDLSGYWDGADGSRTELWWPSVEVAGDTFVNVRVTSRSPRTVSVRDEWGRPVAGARVSLPVYVVDVPWQEGATVSYRPPFGETDAAGDMQFLIPDGVAPPAFDGVVFAPGTVWPPVASFPLWPVGTADPIVVTLRSLDTTPPTVDCDPPPTGWQTDDVAIACGASDSESGLADPRADASFTLTTTVAAGEEDASAFTGTREVCDVAGNCAVAGPLGPVAVDRAAPRIVFEIAPEPLVRGDWWNVSRVAVQVTASDVAGVGSLACSVDGVTRTFAQARGETTISGTFYVNQEGRHVAACTATDRLGHVGSHARDVNLDLKNPLAPTATADRPADDLVYGWHRDTVTVSFTDNGDPLLGDGSAGSGVDPASVPAPQTFDRSGTFTASGTVSDRAGRVSASRSLTVKVDADPPTSTLTCPSSPVSLDANATARWADADGQSGLAGTSGGTVALDTSAVGTGVAAHTAVDRVGHRTTSACRFQVVYPFLLRGGLAAPPALNAVAPGVSTLTVWFSVGGDRGLGIVPAGGLTVQPIGCGDGGQDGRPFPATTSAPLAWDAGTGRYAIAWQVADDLPSGGCAALRITLDDGVTREARFAR